MTLQLGYKGERIDILLVQGADFGPHIATMFNPDESLVNLTGCTIRGGIAKSTQSPLLLPIEVDITAPENGEYQFGLGHLATALLPAGRTEESPESQYLWQLELVDNAGQIFPLFWGTVKVFRGLIL
ncbi:MAG: hypothetical protein K2X63_10300 [Burkholderiaceae bacterium]|nr:hypothetical protein [Burkholderiaceae bacterium]